MSKPIKIHTQAPNSYGIIVLTSGIDWSRFDGNPVMLDSHDDKLLLGKWFDRKEKGTDVIATPEFNEENDHAASKMQEYEKGYLNGASLGLDFDFDDIQVNPALGFGNTPVLVKCQCYEASLCAIPSNPEALKMKAGGEVLSPDQFKQKLQLKLSATNQSIKNHNMNLTFLRKKLNLAASVSDDDVFVEIAAKLEDGNKATAELANLKLSIEAEKSAEIKELLDEAEAAGKFKKEERAEYEEMAAKLSLKACKKLLGLTKAVEVSATNPVKKLIPGMGNQVKAPNTGSLELTAENYNKLHKEGKLLKLKNSDPETYEALLQAKKDDVNERKLVDTKK